MEFKKIMVPIDWADGAEDMVNAAVDLALKVGGELTLLHTWLLPPGIAAHTAVVPLVGGPPIPVGAEVDRDIQARLEELAAPARARGARVRCLVKQGPPADTITLAARDEGADLIMMATHGRTGVKRFFMGSVAEEVVRTSEVPVLTVHLAAMGQRPGTPAEERLADEENG